jgi:hypothetical protein
MECLAMAPYNSVSQCQLGNFIRKDQRQTIRLAYRLNYGLHLYLTRDFCFTSY